MKVKDIRGLVAAPAPAKSLEERLARSCFSVDDMRRIARRRLPGSIFDYIDGGSEDEASLRRNRESFSDWRFLPKWGSVDGLHADTTVLGGPSALPLTLSPTGGTRLFHPQGELAVARAAQAAGIPYGLAHLSTTTLESVSEAAPRLRKWFNIEPIVDKDELDGVLERVSRAGYEALLVNVDCRGIGRRERDYRNGFTAPPTIKPRTVLEGALHPRWSLGFLLNDAIAFPNLEAEAPAGPLASTPDMWKSLLAGSYEPTDWADIEDLRLRWNGKLVLKGCVNPDDVARAASLGVDAVQVSNHGGRQLDHMASPMDVLPELAHRADGRLELIVDGGVRRGVDVVKALALGASAASIGRPYLYGLAAAGETGVRHVIGMFAEEIERTMILLGVSSIEELRHEGPGLIRHRNDVFGRDSSALRPATDR
ncbi:MULTISPECIES: alpha-hydroxy acid oxidase [Arthrobacter]|uniref:Alpha-hydroxy acid oxidase n=2 Tax=Arthrobacter TaxID=1663 RepID=A0ABU9KL02_9MICC|nr:alpha-hydroxy acid oxidase [Arthrobacter sp. YJM1]MDP5226719.1 alpha-hydroxy acid oxidase [Arthrobacter sp. YJM1]